MHTMERFELATHIAESMGYQVRHENLGGASGGSCEFAGKKWIFIDLSLTAVEQLEQLIQAIQEIEESENRRANLGIQASSELLSSVNRRAA